MTTECEDRIAMVKAMEFIARQVNDEELFMAWLSLGVADGDIPYADLKYANCDDMDAATAYAEPENLPGLMDTFLRLMSAARKSGGLYCGGVTSNLG